MASTTLTQHDLAVLDKIRDPESSRSTSTLIDSSLPRDPHITDSALYQTIITREHWIITSIQNIERQLAGLKIQPGSDSDHSIQQYLSCVNSLSLLIDEYPQYASARNNRAQALRRLYGDGMLAKGQLKGEEAVKCQALDPLPSETALLSASITTLDDLDTAISLLTSATSFAPLSPQAAKTLSQAYTQRGALYHFTAKILSASNSTLRIGPTGGQIGRSALEFEEMASRDFLMGGRYGNEVARALAVASNPTAKLCGDMVREAMRKEHQWR